MKRFTWLGILMAVVLTGCSSDKGYSGVDNVWRSATPLVWEAGKTTEQDVIDALGPPSQLIGLDKEKVYYYLREERKQTAVFLLAYNWKNQKLTYDRAIFFFGSSAKSVGAREVFALPESLKWPEIRMAYK